MDCRGLCAWHLVLLLCSAVTAHYLRDGKNETTSSQGTCFYNGTWFEDKEELPTRGLCLVCHCFPGFVEPNAFTCSVIDCPWEDYHRRFPGCTPIYADRDCCPIGWECDYGTQTPGQQLSKDPACDCEWRYLKHYEAKGCRPVYAEKPDKPPACPCPWRFDCSQAEDVQASDRVCLYKKHIYPVGSKIPTSNPCESCSCSTDYFTQAATISCTTAECPAVYSQTPLPEGCHYVYKENQCCPESVECPTAQKDNVYQVPSCEYRGKMFYEGEQIYPEEDPCLICLCNHNWTGINSTSCRQHDCMLERDARKLKQGCIPIYHEKTCCPIDYHCADDDFNFKSNRGASFKSDDDEDEMCYFESRYYEIGHVLDIKHPTNCVTCTCKTPPDFTCIHSSCPPPPNNDYNSCKAVYKPSSCCPDYTCEEKSIDSENAKPNEIIEEAKDDSMQPLIQECKKMQCSADERCMLVEQKCEKEPCLPQPKCEKVAFGCGKTTCPEGCEEIGSYETNCPLCYCKEQIKEPQYQLTCRVQSCEANCVLTGRDESGCPVCKCPQGNLEERACANSPCHGFNCTLTMNTLGCAECRCQLSCRPRECPAGCDLDLDVPDNSGLDCGCTCKNSSTAVEYIQSRTVSESCPAVSCRGLNCSVVQDRSGCPVCSCREPCPAPVCQEGCQVEKEVKDPGRCPGCVCKLSRSIRDHRSKECPAPTCLGYNCSVFTEEGGCQKCVCESPCEETPQCPSHCKLEVNVPEGRCRGCVCSIGATTESDIKPSRGVSTTPESDAEPERREDVDADFIPLPGSDLVPGVDKVYLVHGEEDRDQYAGVPGYHFEGGHAYPVFGEPLESGLYNADDSIPGEFESALPEEAREEEAEEASENRHEEADYGHEEEGYDADFAEEKAMGDEEDEKCKQKNCPDGQKCVIRRLQCIRNPCPTIPVCIDVEPRCPIPMCAIGCMVMKWDDEVCPSCFCGIIRGAEGRVCPRTRCMGRKCYNVIGDDGCPQCKCDSICIPPKCFDGCHIEKDPPAGKCPTCTCPDRGSVVQPIIPVSPTAEAYGYSKYSSKAPPSPIPSYQCPTPHCNGYNCSLIRGPDGCQKCVCDSPCAPCPQHCVKTKTLSEGRCPICDCTVAPPPPLALASPDQRCPAVDCQGSNCRRIKDSEGCYTCVCDPKCVEPQCDPGCEVLRDVPPGQCPGCVCRITVIQAVAQRPRPCATLKCDAGCQVQTNVAAGQCPTCVCNYADEGTSSSILSQSPDGTKTLQQQQQQQSQVAVTFASLLGAGDLDEVTSSTLHTTVTVDLDTVYEPTTTVQPTCPPPVCSGLRCGMETGEDGCEVCKCKYKCPKPKCVGKCYAETNAPSHRCAGCVCPAKPKQPARY